MALLESTANLILTVVYATSAVKMPRIMRRRGLGGRYKGGFRPGFGWDGMRVTRNPTRSRRLALGGSSSLGAALSRVHMFKRVGTPVVIVNAPAAPGFAIVHPSSNASIISGNGALAGNADQFLLNHSYQTGAMKFMLSQASKIDEITDLFDNYRIKRVKLHVQLSFTEASSGGAGGQLPTQLQAAPIMHYCYDPDDNTTPTARTDVLQNGYCKTQRLTKDFYISVTPRAQQPVVGGLGGAGGVVPLGQWMDTKSPNIDFYGLKFWIDQFPLGTAQGQYALTITPTFYIEAKNVV